jgi:putative acetyltransferase
MALGIRPFAPGDEAALREVFYSSIHQLAARDYSAEQLDAWAPHDHDALAWASRIQGIKPFVAQDGGKIAGYADLQPTGYIDHFFVAGDAGGQGVGTALMRHIHERARASGIDRLSANVSLTAQPFFERHGFQVLERHMPVIRGVALANAHMAKDLASSTLAGGCYCGAIRYEASGKIFNATNCHCEMCRRTTGAPCVAWFSVAAKGFRLLAGTPASFRSSEHATRSFCAACGTQLTFADDASPEEIDISTCSLDDPAAVPPVDHTFSSRRVPWLVLDDGLPQFPRSRSEGE